MGGGLWRGAPKKDEAQGTLWGAVCLWWGYIHTATAAQGLLVGNTLAFLDASSVQSLSRVQNFATHGLQHASQILIRYQIPIRFCNYKSMIILSEDQTCGL